MVRNVLLVIADDLGKYVGCYGCKSVQTPNIDSLAAQGVRCDMAFASTASCSGSRSTIYTGLHTHENGQYGLNIFRTHFQTFSHIETMPALFNRAGYLTGILGKVHVGPDEVYPWTIRKESPSRDVAWLADETEAFFRQAKQADKPFCLTVGFVDPHRDTSTRGGFGNEGPFDSRIKCLDIRPEDVEVPSWLSDLPEVRQELCEYYKAIYRTDQGVGMVMQALESQGLADSTLVVFTSDNGPPFLNAKTTLYDAGTCLPMIIRCPGEAKNIANPNMISYIDLLPTFLDWAGLDSKDTPDRHYSTNGVKSTNGVNGHNGVNIAHEQTGTSDFVVPGSGFSQVVAKSPPRLGHSLLPILHRQDRVPASQWQHHVFGSHTFHELQNYWPTRVIRTPRYKYHRNIAWQLPFPFATDLYASYSWEAMRNSAPVHIGGRKLQNYLMRPAEELFDLENDPDELQNLVGDPSVADLLTDLRFTLEKWQQKTRDLWLYRDGCSLLHLSAYAKDNLKVPNRFDMPVDSPGTGGIMSMHVGSKVTPLSAIQKEGS